MQNLEKALKKTKIVTTILIIALILFAIYAIMLSGDVSSAKTKTKMSYNEQLLDLKSAITDIQDETAEYDEKIAGYQTELDQLKADIEAIKGGTYVAD